MSRRHCLLVLLLAVGIVGLSIIRNTHGHGSSLLDTKREQSGCVFGVKGSTIVHDQGDDDASAESQCLEAVPDKLSLPSELHQPQLEEQPTQLQKLVNGLRGSLVDLDAQPSDEQVEEWACLIFESHSAPSRTFHRIQHVFSVAEGANSIVAISAFFHDIVYYSVDGGLSSPLVAEKLKDIITESEGSVALNDIEFDPVTSMVIAIFGFTPGQTLNPFKGLNEFLSAVVAVRCLEDTLPVKVLFQIAACIEATIPFRGKDENGVTVMERLYERLRKANTVFNIGLGGGELIGATQNAVRLNNRDVAGFASDTSATFLSNTWDLLPESNLSFRSTKVYRVSDYARGLKKMTGFFEFLNPEVVFNYFRNEPSDEVLSDMNRRAKNNIEIARRYLRCQLLSISILAALAEQTGGDGPVALFVGDPPQSTIVTPRLEDAFDLTRPQDGIEVDEQIFSLLRDGRERESDFDTKNSPLAAYLYVHLGDSGVQQSLEYAVYPMDKVNAKKLLDSIPKSAVREIASACARVAITRATKLLMIADDYAEA